MMGMAASQVMTSSVVMCVMTWTLPLATEASTDVKELEAFSEFRFITYNESDKNIWVIRASSENDVIGMRVTDWYTPAGFTCSRDRIVIRDGPDHSSPYLRIVCGTMCGAYNDVVEVTSSSNAAYVVYTPFSHSTVRPRGFTLIYRSRSLSPVVRQAIMYTEVNYILMCLSVIVIGGLVGGLLFLYFRELGISRLRKKQQRMDVLKRRRQGFSGQSGFPSRVGSGNSNNVTNPLAPINHFNHYLSPDGGRGLRGWEREEGDNDMDTETAHLEFGGLVTSRVLDMRPLEDMTSELSDHHPSHRHNDERSHVSRDEDSTSQTMMTEVVGP